MESSRKRTDDLIGLAFLATALFIFLALCSYSPTDPVSEPFSPLNRIYQPDVLVTPAQVNVSNWCGPAGAFVADLMLRTVGWSAYYILLSLTVLGAALLLARPIVAPMVRLFGWTLSLAGCCTLTSALFTGTWTGPMIGPGGYFGAIGHGLLVQQVGQAGSVLIGLTALAAGLLLCTDYILLQLASMTATAAANKTIRRRAKTSDLVSERAKPGMQVRIGGKRIAVADDEWDEELDDDLGDELDEEADSEYEDDDEEDEYEYEDEAEDDELEAEGEEEELDPETEQEPSAANRGLRGLIQRASPSLRVRKPKEKRDERQEVIEQLEEASRQEDAREYDLPSIELLRESEDFSFEQQEKEVRRKARILEKTFQDFGFQVKVVEIETGPVIAQYEIELEAGLRLSKITGLADDLAIALRVPSVRIVAPIPGKNTVGIEVPNEQRQVVRLREVMEEANGRASKMRIPLFLGKDVSGNPLAADLSTLPHLLIAGRTGTGKSVCLNAIISSILMTRRPDEVRMLMIDPKMVELSGYKTLPHLMHPVVTDMRKAEAILAWAVDKMEERYALLAQAGVRHISGYNQLGEEELMERLQPEDDAQRQAIPVHLPYIVIVADEMADLMMTAGKEVEQHIIRLAQKSRAVGIHLILATQKPTVDVITGLIKSNLPARIAFQVASRTDSRVVLDEMGADKLLGNGDMLFLWPGTSTLLRGQGTYLSDEEINSIVEAVSTGEQDFINELVHLKVEDPEAGSAPSQLKKRDDLYESAVDIVVREGRGSVSLLQRCLGIGYGRAARLIDFMAEDGIVGPYNGSQAREVVISQADWEAMQAGDTGSTDPEPPADKPRRNPKIDPNTNLRGDGSHTGPAPTTSRPAGQTTQTVRVSAREDEGEEEDSELPTYASTRRSSSVRKVKLNEAPEQEELDDEEEYLDDQLDVEEETDEDEEVDDEEASDEDERQEDESDGEYEEEEEEEDEYDADEYEDDEYEYEYEEDAADDPDGEYDEYEADEYEDDEEEDFDDEAYHSKGK